MNKQKYNLLSFLLNCTRISFNLVKILLNNISEIQKQKFLSITLDIYIDFAIGQTDKIFKKCVKVSLDTSMIPMFKSKNKK